MNYHKKCPTPMPHSNAPSPADGITKCGVMEFLANQASDPTITEDHPYHSSLQISGQQVPLVTEYKYLGLGLLPQLEITALVQAYYPSYTALYSH